MFNSVAQLCSTLCGPMDCSPPGPSVHGDSLGKNTGVGSHALLQGISSTQAQRLKHLPAMWEIWVQSLGWEVPLEQEMATHSTFLPRESLGHPSVIR